MRTVAVSPYHLTTREAPAMAALLLAERCVTLMPSPVSTEGLAEGSNGPARRRAGVAAGEAAPIARRDLDRAVAEAPAYLHLMESWSWAMPLFRSGVVATSHRGRDPAADARRALNTVRTDPRYRPLRDLCRDDLFESERTYLSLVSRDILRGGPDPAVSVPVLAGLDAFAAGVGVSVCRSAATSLAQRIESKGAQKLFAFVAPILTQATAERVANARAALGEPLGSLRAAAEEAVAGRGASIVRAAAEAYADAFEKARDDVCGPPEDQDDVRTVAADVSVTAIELAVDAVLESSLRAARAVGGSRAASPRVSGSTGDGRVVSLVVKVLGR